MKNGTLALPIWMLQQRNMDIRDGKRSTSDCRTHTHNWNHSLGLMRCFCSHFSFSSEQFSSFPSLFWSKLFALHWMTSSFTHSAFGSSLFLPFCFLPSLSILHRVLSSGIRFGSPSATVKVDLMLFDIVRRCNSLILSYSMREKVASSLVYLLARDKWLL